MLIKLFIWENMQIFGGRLLVGGPQATINLVETWSSGLRNFRFLVKISLDDLDHFGFII